MEDQEQQQQFSIHQQQQQLDMQQEKQEQIQQQQLKMQQHAYQQALMTGAGVNNSSVAISNVNGQLSASTPTTPAANSHINGPYAYPPAHFDLFTHSHSLALPFPPNMYMPSGLSDATAMPYQSGMFAATAMMGLHGQPSSAHMPLGPYGPGDASQYAARAIYPNSQPHRGKPMTAAELLGAAAKKSASSSKSSGPKNPRKSQNKGKGKSMARPVTTEEATAGLATADPSLGLVTNLLQSRYRSGNYNSTDEQSRTAQGDENSTMETESASTPFSHAVSRASSPLVYPDDSLIRAAVSAGLPFESMTGDETRIFPQFDDPINQSMYLDARNRILRAWLQRPTKALTLGEALHVTQMHRPDLCMTIYQYLRRVCAINFGLVKPPYAHKHNLKSLVSGNNTTNSTGNHRRPKTFLIIGAGAAGLAAARQLRQLFDSEFDTRPPPIIILLEARSRVGGRVYTHPLHTKARTSLAPTALSFVTGVDLGAKIVTGWEGGNPMKIIAKKQLKLLAYDVVKSAHLNDADGTLISEAIDAKGERIFNQILDAASRLKEDELKRHGALIEDRLRRQVNSYTGHSISSSLAASAAVVASKKRRLTRKQSDDSMDEDDEEFVMSTGEGDDLDSTVHNGCSDNETDEDGNNLEKNSADSAIGKCIHDTPLNPVANTVNNGRLITNKTTVEHKDSSDLVSTSVMNETNGKSDLNPIIPSLTASGNVVKADIPSLGPVLDRLFKDHAMFKDLSPVDFRVIHWHFANLEFGNATTLNKLSLYHWDQDDEFELFGPHSMIVGGYGQVTHALAYGAKSISPFAIYDHAAYSAPLPEPGLAVDRLDIRFGKVVDKINWRSATKQSLRDASAPGSVADAADNLPSVEVVCKDGSRFSGDAVIVTLPLGVLKAKAVTFEPTLPSWKVDSIKRMGFGTINKVVLVFKKPFWDTNIDSFGYLNEAGTETVTPGNYDPALFAKVRGRFYIFWNMAPVVKLPVLIGLLVGQAAYDIEGISDSEIVSQTLDVLAKIHPNAQPLPQPIETVITRWSFDEYARGSYSYVATGATGNDYDILAKPVGNTLFFAGEATCRQYPATVHGAILSGMAAATNIANTFLGDVRFVEDRKYKRTLPASAETAIRSQFSVGDILEKNAIASATPVKRKRRSMVKTKINSDLTSDNFYSTSFKEFSGHDNTSGQLLDQNRRRRRARYNRRYNADSDEASGDEDIRPVSHQANKDPVVSASSAAAEGSATTGQPSARAWQMQKIVIKYNDKRDVVCWVKGCQKVCAGSFALMKHLLTHMEESEQTVYSDIAMKDINTDEVSGEHGVDILPMLPRRLLPVPPKPSLKNPFLIFTRIMWDAAKAQLAQGIDIGQLATRSELGRVWAVGDPEVKKTYIDEVQRLKKEFIFRTAQYHRQLEAIGLQESTIASAGIFAKEHGSEISINFGQFSASEFMDKLTSTDYLNTPSSQKSQSSSTPVATTTKKSSSSRVPLPLLPSPTSVSIMLDKPHKSILNTAMKISDLLHSSGEQQTSTEAINSDTERINEAMQNTSGSPIGDSQQHYTKTVDNSTRVVPRLVSFFDTTEKSARESSKMASNVNMASHTHIPLMTTQSDSTLAVASLKESNQIYGDTTVSTLSDMTSHSNVDSALDAATTSLDPLLDQLTNTTDPMISQMRSKSKSPAPSEM